MCFSHISISLSLEHEYSYQKDHVCFPRPESQKPDISAWNLTAWCLHKGGWQIVNVRIHMTTNVGICMTMNAGIYMTTNVGIYLCGRIFANVPFFPDIMIFRNFRVPTNFPNVLFFVDIMFSWIAWFPGISGYLRAPNSNFHFSQKIRETWPH